jgi:hypothetical protein
MLATLRAMEIAMYLNEIKLLEETPLCLSVSDKE